MVLEAVLDRSDGEAMMDYDAHINVMCSMIYQRGSRTATGGIRTVTRKQIENVVKKYVEREDKIFTTTELLRVSTDRWVVDPTMDTNVFLIVQRGF
jgi:hypothetical protein